MTRDEKRYLTALRKGHLLGLFFSDDEAINAGKDICRTYRTGGSIPLEDIEVAFDAIKWFCPQFEDLIQVFP